MKPLTSLIASVATATSLLTTSLMPARADDFFIGTRGPTPLQFDHGMNYVRRETPQGVSDNWIQSNVVKYWTGKEKGLFAIGALPYRSLESEILFRCSCR